MRKDDRIDTAGIRATRAWTDADPGAISGTRGWPPGEGTATPARPEGSQGTRPFPGFDPAAAPPFDAEPLRNASLQSGAFVAGRYRVERNLGLGGGESEIYLCLDEHLPAEHRDRQVVLKLYKTSLAPKKEVLDAIRNLSHPDLIRVLDLGVWADGRFFEVLEYCRGGSMADTMPYPVGDLVDALDQIVNALDYCHHQLGIIHRDIKPNNLLFRDASRTDLVLTDFGISSYLRQWQKGGLDRTHTSTAGRHTLDYAAPELFGQDEVSPKTDYYGLGITLIHLLTGRSPFEGLREETVVLRHVSNQIPLPEHLDQRLELLLRGLTQRTPENRWGYRQIRQWRQGTEILDDQGRPWIHRPHLDRPFPYFTRAKTPAELAHCLDQFDAARRMASHHISYWVAEFDPALAEEIEKLEKTVEKNPALAVKKLGWLLDPELPLTL
ncbi:putative Calcium/calmodulin-dependent protein kinase [Thiocapsa sp. KS1]|nr:serine/threonine-protein kinase [Thiocapsa sp. KS1]CRI67737.1 putative Calcium/calmodulin-dependent protein kinase [Thiocapsa sp. KS1]